MHGHFLVNGRKVDIPSFQVGEHDVIDVRPKSIETTPFIIAADPRRAHRPRLARGAAEQDAVLVHSLPVRQQIDVPVQEQLIVEFYSRSDSARGLPPRAHRNSSHLI